MDLVTGIKYAMYDNDILQSANNVCIKKDYEIHKPKSYQLNKFMYQRSCLTYQIWTAAFLYILLKQSK